MKPGDKVAVFLGANVPILICKQGQESYRIIGELFIRGIMEGEVFEKDHKIEGIVVE